MHFTCDPRDLYVLVEQIHPKAGLPALGNTLGPSMFQVYRAIYNLCDLNEILFRGRRIDGHPSSWQRLQALVSPARTLSTAPTGETRFRLVYAGFKNIGKPLPKVENMLPEAWTRKYDWWTPSVFHYGQDPIPWIRLYGNPMAHFVMPGGQAPASCIGLYRRDSGHLSLPAYDERKKIIKELVHPRPARATLDEYP